MLVAVIVAATALGPIVIALNYNDFAPLSVLAELYLGPDAVARDDNTVAEIVVSLVPALLLLALAAGLSRGRRFAWWAAVVLHLAFLVVGGLYAVNYYQWIVDHDLLDEEYSWFAHLVPLVIVPLVVLGILLVTGRIFTVRAPAGTYPLVRPDRGLPGRGRSRDHHRRPGRPPPETHRDSAGIRGPLQRRGLDAMPVQRHQRGAGRDRRTGLAEPAGCRGNGAAVGLTGVQRQEVSRHSPPISRATKAGITAEWIVFPQAPLSIRDQIEAISEEWVSDKSLPEMGFTLGGINELDDTHVRCLIAIDGDRTIHGSPAGCRPTGTARSSAGRWTSCAAARARSRGSWNS